MARGAACQPGFTPRSPGSCRLSPVSHGNTIALFFRSLLPNYTMEVRGAGPGRPAAWAQARPVGA